MSASVGRSKIKRLRAPVPPTIPPWQRLLQRLQQRLPPRLRRIVGPALIAAAVLSVLLPFTLWARYQILYVVSRNALVKGAITSVGAQLDGVVTSVEVDTGQRVQAGQVLARAIQQERRRLAGVVAEASARSAAARAQAEAAQSQADEARNQHKLRESLAKGGVIAQEELRTAETTRRTAEAVRATANADERAARAAQHLAEVESEGLNVREQHLVVLEADVEAFRAELALAEADLKAALIRAPADGWVLRRIAEPGASVVVGQPVVALWIGNEVWVEAWIEEDDLAKVKPGNAARVTVKPFPRRVFSGEVESIGVSTDYELPDAAVPQPRNARIRAAPVVCVRVRLDEADGLLPGLSAVVGIRK
jgi:membrane fusion protein (multidrug efflux system)